MDVREIVTLPVVGVIPLAPSSHSPGHLLPCLCQHKFSISSLIANLTDDRWDPGVWLSCPLPCAWALPLPCAGPSLGVPCALSAHTRCPLCSSGFGLSLLYVSEAFGPLWFELQIVSQFVAFLLTVVNAGYG